MRSSNANIEPEYRGKRDSQASINAEKIETANPGVVVVIMVSVAVTACAIFFDQPHVAWFLLLPLIVSTITLLKISQWFRWCAPYKFDHEDFVAARGKSEARSSELACDARRADRSHRVVVRMVKFSQLMA